MVPIEPLVMQFGYDALGRRVETFEHVDPASGDGFAEPRHTRHVYLGLETIQEYACGADGTAANLPNEWPCTTSMPLVRKFVWGDPNRERYRLSKCSALSISTAALGVVVLPNPRGREALYARS